MIAGVCGATREAVREAECATRLGYHAALLSLGALRDATVDQLIDHARAVGEVMPLVGFYLQPAVGGRILEAAFWRRFAALESVIAIKVAPFHRYQTIDVLHGVADSGRAGEIALYTGNDDHIILDLITEFRGLRFAGGLLGQWAVWTRRAVEMLDAIHRDPGDPKWRLIANDLTDANAAIFDVANQFHGCIAGIHEVLRRQGLLDGFVVPRSERVAVARADGRDRPRLRGVSSPDGLRLYFTSTSTSRRRAALWDGARACRRGTYRGSDG
jgi:dihydrodipicolinate synthase/N-acetylneuraminate lyase